MGEKAAGAARQKAETMSEEAAAAMPQKADAATEEGTKRAREAGEKAAMRENAEAVRERVEGVYRAEGRRVFATLVRLLGDFDLAEEGLHDAFMAALEQWPTDGIPANPRAWLVSAGRFKAIDRLRRRARFDAAVASMAEELGAGAGYGGATECGARSEAVAADGATRAAGGSGRVADVSGTSGVDANGSRGGIGASGTTGGATSGAVGAGAAGWVSGTSGGSGAWGAAEPDDEGLEDDRLRLIFTCCHPALQADARVALTLREVCGLTTEEIARAFLTAPPTLAQRIVRAKAKIREARIPYQVPAAAELPERLDTVLQVVYLVFNEGYSASSGESVTRADLSGEAIRLGRLLLELLPEPEVMGLLALMLLQESRRTARSTPSGDLVLLEEQDRSQWNREHIAEGLALAQRALGSGRVGAYTVQAAIAAVHAGAATAAATDWARIVALYDLLARAEPSPVVELNRAVAVAMRDGPAAGLPLIDAILERGELAEYHLAHSARADLCRRLGRVAEARAAYERALGLARQEPERRFLQRRLKEVTQNAEL